MINKNDLSFMASVQKYEDDSNAASLIYFEVSTRCYAKRQII
jgi:hypothetical protein